MSGEGRSRRNIQRVNYAEPGDNPDESALEPSVEGVQSSAAAAETSFTSVDDQDSFVSAESQTTVVASVGDTIGEPLLGSSPNPSVVEEEVRDMASSRANQLTAELGAIFFQVGEIKDDVETGLETMSTTELNGYVADLKDLRVQLVKAHQELNLLKD